MAELRVGGVDVGRMADVCKRRSGRETVCHYLVKWSPTTQQFHSQAFAPVVSNVTARHLRLHF